MTDDERAAVLRFDKDVYEAALGLVTTAPLDLTEGHFDQLAMISTRQETDAREAQKAAQLAIVQAHTAAPLRTKAAPVAPKSTMLQGLVKALALVMREYIDARTAPLDQRLATLEAKPHVKFCGVWRAGGTYQPGDAATHQGALWICKAATAGEPNKDFVGWQLAVKRGGA